MEAPVTFYDVAVSFSEEEWTLLNEWQRERYMSVMKIIHQALISLGYQIVNTDTLVRIKKKEKICICNSQNAQKNVDIDDPSSTCFQDHHPDILLRVKREEEVYCKDWSNLLRYENSNETRRGDAFANSSILCQGKTEKEIYLAGSVDTKKEESNDCLSTGFSFLKTEEEEEAESNVPLMDCCASEGNGNKSPASDHEVISFVIKEEHDTYSVDHHDFKSKESIKSCTGVGNMTRKWKNGDCITSTEKQSSSRAPQGKTKNKVCRRSRKGENSSTLLWSDCFQENSEENSSKLTRFILTLNNEFEKSSIEQKSLIKHQTTRAEKRHYQCAECKKSFSQKSNLDAHQRTHTGEKPFHCIECDKSFNCKGVLIRHQRTHRGERPYQCNECGKSFSQKVSLIVHNRIHTGVRPYQCSECEKSFIVKGNLIGHERTHKGEKPFQCTECVKSFSRKGDLILHQKSHSGERPYQCTECEKSFIRKSHLGRHQRTHTGDRPYLCSECGKSFSQKGNLMIHQKRHIELPQNVML